MNTVVGLFTSNSATLNTPPAYHILMLTTADWINNRQQRERHRWLKTSDSLLHRQKSFDKKPPQKYNGMPIHIAKRTAFLNRLIFSGSVILLHPWHLTCTSDNSLPQLTHLINEILRERYQFPIYGYSSPIKTEADQSGQFLTGIPTGRTTIQNHQVLINGGTS